MSILQHDIMAQAKGNTKSKASTLAKVSIVAALTLWGGVTNPLFALDITREINDGKKQQIQNSQEEILNIKQNGKLNADMNLGKKFTTITNEANSS